MKRYRERGCQPERQSTRKTRQSWLEREQQPGPGCTGIKGGRRSRGIHTGSPCTYQATAAPCSALPWQRLAEARPGLPRDHRRGWGWQPTRGGMEGVCVKGWRHGTQKSKEAKRERTPFPYPQGILRRGIQLPFQHVEVAQLDLEHGGGCFVVGVVSSCAVVMGMGLA